MDRGAWRLQSIGSQRVGQTEAAYHHCRMIFPILTVKTFHQNLWLVCPLEPSLSPIQPNPGTVNIVDKHVVTECK